MIRVVTFGLQAHVCAVMSNGHTEAAADWRTLLSSAAACPVSSRGGESQGQVRSGCSNRRADRVAAVVAEQGPPVSAVVRRQPLAVYCTVAG